MVLEPYLEQAMEMDVKREEVCEVVECPDRLESARQYLGRILMLVECNFPRDVRVLKEADTLRKAGYKISVIAVREGGEKATENVNGIRVYRIPKITVFQDNKSGLPRLSMLFHRPKMVAGYILEHVYFTMACFLLSLYISVREGFDVIHAHNPPDTLFILAAFYRFLGKKFVFDHHDLAPELYLTKMSGKEDIIYKTLILSEKLSCKISQIVISTNQSYKHIVMTRHHIKSDKVYIVRNDPIMSEFSFQEDSRKAGDRKRLLFLGSINPQDGVDILLRILHYLVNELYTRDFSCLIIGDGDSLPSVKQVARELHLDDFVEFTGLIHDRKKVCDYLHSADICIEPAPENALNRHSTFIKVMEYMAAAKPIVAFDLKETRYSANGAAILVPPGEIKEFAFSVKNLLEDASRREKLGKAGLERIKNELNWGKAAFNLTEAYRSVFRSLSKR